MSKDEICDKHFCPSNECGNLSCTEGHIGTPSDHKMQENFIQYCSDKKKYVSQSRRYGNLNHCLRGNFVCIYYCSSGTVLHMQNIIRNVWLH